MVLFFFLSILCSLFKENKEKACREVFRMFQMDVLNFIKIKVNGNLFLAEDIYQDAALSFIKYVSGRNLHFENDNKVKNLLITIALNKIRDYFRKNKRTIQKTKIFKTEEEFNECINRIKSEVETPIENIISKEKIISFKNAVDLVMTRIPENYKEVLILKFIENKGNQEIAEKLKISIKATESLIVRAKIKFKEELLNSSMKEDIFVFFQKGAKDE